MNGETTYCTVKEAASLTGATEWEVRTWIRQVVLYGTAKEQRLVEQRKGKWRIAMPLLDQLAEQHRPQHTGTDTPPRPIEAVAANGNNKYLDGFLETLQSQLKKKDLHIDALHNKLDSILERMRELNVIVNELQKQRVVVQDGTAAKVRKKKKASAKSHNGSHEKPVTGLELPAPGPAYRSFREWVQMMGGQVP